MSYPMALMDRRFNVRLQNIPRGDSLDEEGLYTWTQTNDIFLQNMNPLLSQIQAGKEWESKNRKRQNTSASQKQ